MFEGMGGYIVGSGSSSQHHLLVALSNDTIVDWLITGTTTQTLEHTLSIPQGAFQIAIADNGDSCTSRRARVESTNIPPGRQLGTQLAHTNVQATIRARTRTSGAWPSVRSPAT